MKIKIQLFLSLLAAGSFQVQAQKKIQKYSFDRQQATLVKGRLVHQLPVTHVQPPAVKLVDATYEICPELPADSLLQQGIDAHISTRKKQNYAIVSLPAYRKDDSGVWQQLNNYTIEIEASSLAGDDIPAGTMSADRSKWRTTVTTSSALAGGTWQKLALGARGIYKVDYDFVKNTLGQSGNISSSDIRLLGNGGTMLYEANYVLRPDDLVENPLEMYDGGDGIFGPGDYFLFYANGPLEWTKDSVNQLFHHRTNLYSDHSCYFISFNSGAGKRIGNAVSSAPSTVTVTTYNDYMLHEEDRENIGLFGKVWWGNPLGFSGGLSSSITIPFNVKNIKDTVRYAYQMASAAVGRFNTASLYVNINGIEVGKHENLYGISGEDATDPGVPVRSNGSVAITGFSSGTINVNISYEKYVSIAKAYIDYVELNLRRDLIHQSGTQLTFRDWRSVAPAAVARFSIAGADAGTKVWDITDPLQPERINGSLVGSDYVFNRDASRLREYVVFDASFLTPAYIGPVANQNLHGLSQTDYIIVSHPDMIGAAEKLANYHRNEDGMNVIVVDVNHVYNEFSSGSPDISAIRDFVKMFYDRAGTDETKMPKYLLLLGQASYDYKNITRANPRMVPTYETDESLSANYGHSTDDFYAFLDSSENVSEGFPLLDIGVGRIPATNAAEANDVVDKIIRYKSNASLGPWRLNNMYVGDNEDGAGGHLRDADAMYKVVTSTTNIYNEQKVYLDNMNIISTPGGVRCPDANKVINDNVYKGTFLINYCGHGSIYTLAHERIVTQDDYNSWNNMYKLPILITATCDFSRFDNPALQSAGEKIMLKTNGGAIALVTTTQVVYATYNRDFNGEYLRAQFTKKEHGWNTFGEAFQIAKNYINTKATSEFDLVNSRKFALLGDPALVPNFPRYDVRTDSAFSVVADELQATDSIQSLGKYRVFGSVRDDDGYVMADFNGKVYITVYDKPQEIAISTAISGSAKVRYTTQNNIVYKGLVTVQGGNFNYEFIAPKDINYDFGKGKTSYYAENGIIDASGADTMFTVGGFSAYAEEDNDAPVVRPYMNDSLFMNGGLTGTNSILYAVITDKSGINVSGNYVGHDLTAVLDDQYEIPYILNDYYQTAPNTFQRGYVNFPITGIADGVHKLRVKAWDVYNNSGEGVVVFEVREGKVVEIRNLYTYPNPFSDKTNFVFEHNHPNEPLTATVYIYNTAGSLVKILEQSFTPTGSRTAELSWDGTGNGGERLPSGVYPFRIKIATEKNIEDLGYQKIVLVR